MAKGKGASFQKHEHKRTSMNSKHFILWIILSRVCPGSLASTHAHTLGKSEYV